MLSTYEPMPTVAQADAKRINLDGLFRKMQECGHCPLKDYDFVNLARTYGIGTGTMQQLIKKHALDARLEDEAMGRRKLEFDGVKGRELFEAGKTDLEIAAEMGTSLSAVQKWRTDCQLHHPRGGHHPSPTRTVKAVAAVVTDPAGEVITDVGPVSELREPVGYVCDAPAPSMEAPTMERLMARAEESVTVEMDLSALRHIMNDAVLQAIDHIERRCEVKNMDEQTRQKYELMELRNKLWNIKEDCELILMQPSHDAHDMGMDSMASRIMRIIGDWKPPVEQHT